MAWPDVRHLLDILLPPTSCPFHSFFTCSLRQEAISTGRINPPPLSCVLCLVAVSRWQEEREKPLPASCQSALWLRLHPSSKRTASTRQPSASDRRYWLLVSVFQQMLPLPASSDVGGNAFPSLLTLGLCYPPLANISWLTP